MPALPPPSRVAVLRALPGLGDLLCAVPALRAVRAAWPDAEVTLVGLAGAAWFVERFGHYLDDLLVARAFPGLPELSDDPAATRAFLAEARARRFDLALQLHGDGSVTNSLVARLGARRSAGAARPGAERPDPEGFVDYPDHGHEIDRLLAVTGHLGLPGRGRQLEWPVRAGDDEPVAGVPEGPLACLHPGSSLPSRRWPPARFAAVGDRLARAGLNVVLTGGTAEAPLTAAVQRHMEHPAVDASGATSLGQLGTLVGRSALVVTNDTGMSHLAAAVGTPSVVLFTVSDPERWAPLDRTRHRIVATRAPAAEASDDEGLARAIAHCEELLAAAGRVRVIFGHGPRPGGWPRGAGG